jgi:hypothetical protein
METKRSHKTFLLMLNYTAVKGKIHPRKDHEGPEGVEVKLYCFFNLGAR